MKNRRFTTEFKKDAARMLIIDGVKAKDLSEQLGVHPSLLYGWKNKYLEELEGKSPDGEPFRSLLNHDVYIEPEAEAVHGYTREYLRKHGADPMVAHRQFHEYCGTEPVVAYNISYDWDRVLLPEYDRLGIPQTGSKGFCALTLARRAITETPNLKLPTLKEHFNLSNNPSHRGLNDVESLVRLFSTVLRPRLEPAGISGFELIAKFSKLTPVAKCLEQLHSAYDQQEVWHVMTEDDKSAGPFSLSHIRELTVNGDCYLWREGMLNWELSSKLPEFSESFLKPKKKTKADKTMKMRKPRTRSEYQESLAEVKASLNQLVSCLLA